MSALGKESFCEANQVSKVIRGSFVRGRKVIDTTRNNGNKEFTGFEFMYTNMTMF